MKKITILISFLALSACGGGSGGGGSNAGIPETPNGIINPENEQGLSDSITTNMVSFASNEAEAKSALISYVGARLDGVYDSTTINKTPKRNRAAMTSETDVDVYNKQYEIALNKLQKMHETLNSLLNKTHEQILSYISTHNKEIEEALKLYVDSDVFANINWGGFNVEDILKEQPITQYALDNFDEKHDFNIIRQNIEDIDFSLYGDAIYGYNNMNFVVEQGKVKQITLANTFQSEHTPNHILKHKSDNSFNVEHFIYEPAWVSGIEDSLWYSLTQGETIDETKWRFESDKRLSLEEIKQRLKDNLSGFCPSCDKAKIAQFNAKIDSLTEENVRGGKDVYMHMYNLAVFEKGLVGETELVMLGNNIGLQYADFGYIDGDLTVYDAINGKENNSSYGVFAGGYNAKEIKYKPDDGSVFVGSAVADITKEIQNRTENGVDVSKSYMLTKTDDAKLEIKDGKEKLTMNFSKDSDNPWYNMVVTSNSFQFSGDDSKVNKDFRLSDDMKNISVQNEDYYHINKFTPRYFGDNGTATESVVTSTVNTDNSEAYFSNESESQYIRFTIDSAFGGKK